MIPVTRKAVEDLPSWPLVEPADLFTALTELKDLGWDGAIDSGVWSLRLSCSGKQTVNAELGQWLVLDGELRTVAPNAFPDSYESPEEIVFPEPDVVEEPDPEPEPEPQTSPDTSVPLTRTVR